MKTISLFSGIDGIARGVSEVEKVELVLQAELDPFATKILELRYPSVPRVKDVREIDAGAPKAELVTAGFPCQPVSQAGLQKAQEDERWLWPEVARVLRIVEPRRVLIENVAGLRDQGLADVLHDLLALGYSAQWDLVPAAAVGAPHIRHRYWLVGYRPDEPMGRIFDGPPPIFQWPDEEDAKPRLVGKTPFRRQRLTALGNAVVPQAAAATWIGVVRAAATPTDVVAGRMGFRPSLWTQLPRAGALIDGLVYEFPRSVGKVPRRRLWPTATASDAIGSRRATARRDDWTSNSGETLTDAVWLEEGVDPHSVNGQRADGELLWPSPAARDHKGPSGAGFLERRRGGPDLAAAVVEAERLWPTPKASPSGPDYARAGREESGGDDLATAVARDESIPGATSLNPCWVEWLMGYPLGWTDPDDDPILVKEARQ